LAEAYSRDSGVALAFTLSPDLEAYADFEGDLALVRAGSRAEVLLEEELRHASLLTSGVERVGRATVQGQPFTAVLVPTLEDESGRAVPGSIVWKDVAIGSESAVFAFLGLADGADPDSDGVVFAVRVDGELVGSQAVQPGARWKSKLFDLRRFAGRNVALELSVDPRQTAIGDSALWGRPVLVHGLDRSPLEAWAAER
jgi:hypothetical protein